VVAPKTRCLDEPNKAATMAGVISAQNRIALRWHTGKGDKYHTLRLHEKCAG